MSEKTKKPAEPRDAASVIMLRGTPGDPEVLVGRRPEKARFMPSVWVFPGGAVEEADFQLQTPHNLREDVLARLTRTTAPRLAHALAWTALREMREETGLLLGKTGDDNSATESEAHDAYQRAGIVPNLTALDYLMRACTPEYQPIRFNTRFFIADGTDTSGNIWQTSELEEICWIRLNELPDMKIAGITGIVIEQAQQYWFSQPSPDPDRTVMFFSADMDHNRIWQEE
ncbi:NUDIX domain-containing protein [Alphaproteobacteria bacterium]|jgi:8-oxo-dGTP pyrophosphatase MutT (NUDIX family)|nr:NUDIX domain-containing protein [Alphaproteobacteria bacterium]